MSKRIGTPVETAVVRALRKLGFEGADRQPLRGNRDQGDIAVCPGVIAEVKGGHMAETASDNLITEWLKETEVERQWARADFGLLVIKRKGVGAANANRWWAWIAVDRELNHVPEFGAVPILLCHPRFRLEDVAYLLRRWGYGSTPT